MDYKKGYWIIEDTYPETNESIIQANMKELGISREQATFIKLLEWDYPFQMAKVYFVEEIKVKKTLFQRFWGGLKRYFNEIWA